MAVWIVIAIGFAVIAALALLIWLWWQVPKWQMRGRIFKGEKERADAEDNFRKTVGQALGGAAVLIGAGAAYLQFSQQQQAAHDLLISNQVAKGFEQLAGKEVAMRLGGIYGLEGVMNGSAQYWQPVLEALCAFVREGTIGKTVSADGPTTDIQAALTVIGRRKLNSEESINLSKANIPKAILFHAHLTGNLSGVNLSRANMFGIDLSSANLEGANLSDADVAGAIVGDAAIVANLSGANLISANLSGANLIGANLRGVNLAEADLSGARLRNTDLTGACLGGGDGCGVATSHQGSARNLTLEQLGQACGRPASLPPGLTLDNPCLPVAPPLNRKTTP